MLSTQPRMESRNPDIQKEQKQRQERLHVSPLLDGMYVWLVLFVRVIELSSVVKLGSPLTAAVLTAFVWQLSCFTDCSICVYVNRKSKRLSSIETYLFRQNSITLSIGDAKVAHRIESKAN